MLIALSAQCIKPKEIFKFLILMTTFLYVSYYITDQLAQSIEWKNQR